MPHQEDRILWLDLETTGSDPDSDIIEVGAVLTDGSPELKPIACFTAVVTPRDANKLLGMSEAVVDMHLGNGLVKDLLDGSGTDLRTVEDHLLKFLGDNAPGSEQIPLAGSGVSHFDRQFIRRDWPRLDKRLTYWAYDVGVVRRTFRLINLRQTIVSKDDLQHRALSDALDHAQEMREYLRALEGTGLPRLERIHVDAPTGMVGV